MGDTEIFESKDLVSAIKKAKSGWASKINTGMLAVIMFTGWHYGQKVVEQIEKQDSRISSLEVALGRLSQQVEDMTFSMNGARSHSQQNRRMNPSSPNGN